MRPASQRVLFDIGRHEPDNTKQERQGQADHETLTTDRQTARKTPDDGSPVGRC